MHSKCYVSVATIIIKTVEVGIIAMAEGFCVPAALQA